MPSIRAIAKELGISHSYLSYMVNGKRPWSPDLYNRYQQLVTTPPSVVTTSQPNLNTKTRDPLLDTGEVTGGSPVPHTIYLGQVAKEETNNLHRVFPCSILFWGL